MVTTRHEHNAFSCRKADAVCDWNYTLSMMSCGPVVISFGKSAQKPKMCAVNKQLAYGDSNKKLETWPAKKIKAHNLSTLLGTICRRFLMVHQNANNTLQWLQQSEGLCKARQNTQKARSGISWNVKIACITDNNTTSTPNTHTEILT